MVGTPTKVVTRSRSISSRARSGSHLYIITSFAPDAVEPSMTGMSPVTWNSGTMRMKAVRSFGPSSSLGGSIRALDRGAAAEGEEAR